ncbi:MAG TPA: cation diffusion facilitator family transporter, partial [Allocoleopsis sp.]
WIALILISVFALAEFGMGWFSHSLALVAESGHMLSDGVALVLALLATWIARLPASNQAPFGYRRVEILAALINGIGLIGIAIWIAQEAIERLQAPPEEILSLPMLMTAAIGLVVNSINASLLHQDSHTDLNLRGAFWHMVADAISSIGVIIAAVLVWVWGWNWADGAISLGVAIFIAIGALPIIRQSLHILLEKTPEHLDLVQIQTHLESFAGIEAVSHLRIWSIALGQDALSAHLTVHIKDGLGRDRLLHQIQTSLQQEFGIAEIFLQMTAPMPLNLSHPPDLAVLLQTGSPETAESPCKTEV